MTKTKNEKQSQPGKMATGITGLDDCLAGGMPRRRTTLLMGGPGCGKTVMALQTLVNGARIHREAGIFVAFEENSRQIIENAASFGWNIPVLEKKNLFFLDAKLPSATVQSGDFDLVGMLSMLTAKAKQMNVQRIVFDSIDVLLGQLDNATARRKELYRLYDWLLDSGLSAIVTAKTDNHIPLGDGPITNMQFMADCVIQLNHELSNQISIRNLRVKKYRGSSFLENQVPMSISGDGIEVSAELNIEQKVPASMRRVSTGIERLDTMLNGGYFKGSSILITGAPGTAKSTLAALFADAACRRKERALYVSFDSSGTELIRNFRSINIDFKQHLEAGRLLVHSVLADGCSAKDHFLRIRALVDKHEPDCVIIDPISALVKGGGESHAQGIAERLILLGRSRGITILNTSLLDSADQHSETTPIHVSTIADTWIHLSYLIHAGERNRALTIIKARGTRHSNQVRELILSDNGVSLTDAYTAGGEVLMGTLRWQKEYEDRIATEREQADLDIQRREYEYTEQELSARRQLLQHQLDMKKTELEALEKQERFRIRQRSEYDRKMQQFRSADGAPGKRRTK